MVSRTLNVRILIGLSVGTVAGAGLNAAFPGSRAVTVLFLAQSFGITLSLGTQALVVVFTARAAGVPAGAIPLMVVLLESVGIPGQSIALIFGGEPILEMARTSTNVTGDLFASLAISHSEGFSTALTINPPTPAGAGVSP